LARAICPAAWDDFDSHAKLKRWSREERETEIAERSQMQGRIGASVRMAEAALAEVLSWVPDDAVWLAAKLRVDANDLQRRGFAIRGARCGLAASAIETLAIAASATKESKDATG
jgi:hypothetical protein